jgi:hypothetical protein
MYPRGGIRSANIIFLKPTKKWDQKSRALAEKVGIFKNELAANNRESNESLDAHPFLIFALGGPPFPRSLHWVAHPFRVLCGRVGRTFVSCEIRGLIFPFLTWKK